jgi:hypothetical protein
MLKFFSALAILLLALFAEIVLASVGLHFSLALAVLIAFAFVLDFWELLILDLVAVFILNWQPAPSAALIAFALVPLAAFAFYKLTHWHGWTGVLVAVIAGFLIFYIVAAPGFFLHDLAGFMLDLIVGLLVGEAVLAGVV